MAWTPIRLLGTVEKRQRDLAKKLDRPLPENGWRIYVSGQVWTIFNGKAKAARGSEAALVETLAKWKAQVEELLPERLPDLVRIVNVGIANPRKDDRGER